MVWIYHAFFEPGTCGNKRETEHEQGLWLLRRALRERYGIECREGRPPELVEGAHGKPYLKEYPQIHFNISHCMGLAVLAIGDCTVGIDAECVRPYREPLLKRVLSDAELRQMEEAGGVVFPVLDSEGKLCEGGRMRDYRALTGYILSDW